MLGGWNYDKRPEPAVSAWVWIGIGVCGALFIFGVWALAAMAGDKSPEEQPLEDEEQMMYLRQRREQKERKRQQQQRGQQ